MIQFTKLFSRILLLFLFAFVLQPIVYALLIIVEGAKAGYAFITNTGYRKSLQWPSVSEFREFFNL